MNKMVTPKTHLTKTAWKIWENEPLKYGIRSVAGQYIDKKTSPISEQRKIWQDMINLAAEVLDE